ncbi:MAG TPA: hypothetical protein VLH08_06185 [Acidobacteriota bacterium]|nr:hypothetical protein [Acidobacteriota bacterium]
MKLRVAVLSIVISAFVYLIAEHSVYRTIEKLRFKVIEEPSPAAADGTMLLRYSNPRPAYARVLVIRLINDSEQDRKFVIRQNGLGIKDFTAKPKSISKQVFVIPEPAICERCRLTIIGENAQWKLHTAEVRNVFGFSSAWLEGIIGQASFLNYTKLRSLELGLIIILTFLVSTQLLTMTFSKKLLIPAIVSCVICIVIFFIDLSDFKVLLSTSAFIKLWLISFLPVWIFTYKKIRVSPVLKPIFVGLIVGLIFTGGMLTKLDEHDGNFSGFLNISKKFLGRNELMLEYPEIRRELIKLDSNGYDGQFFYFMAFDPLIRIYQITANPNERPIDVPVFRYRRIAYPVLTKLFSLNNPHYFPVVMVLLIIAGVTFCGFFISKIAVSYNFSGWEGLYCILIPAFWFSLSVSTPEPLAAAFLAGGFFLGLKKHYWPAAILFSIALLTRESAALFVVILALVEFMRPGLADAGNGGRASEITKSDARFSHLITAKPGLKAALILFSALLPYFVWRGYVAISLLNVNGWKGFFMEPANLGLPFSGVIQMYSHVNAGTYIEDIALQATVLPIVLFTLLFGGAFAFLRLKNTAGLICAVYAFLALSLSYDKVWIDVTNVERQSYESFLSLGLLYATRSKMNKLNIVLLIPLIAIVIYDFIMVRSDAFKAGLFWLLKA